MIHYKGMSSDMNILAIGNSFSMDAARYLHGIARAAGVNLNIANLYIGGCPLDKHYRNMLSGERVYELQFNGEATGFKVSLDEALLNRKWDIVTLQQASHLSTNRESYEPYIERLLDYVRECQPKAKVYLHETWAYEDGSTRLMNMFGYEHYDEMLADVKAAYYGVYESFVFDGLIPSGELLSLLLRSGIEKVHRDTFHASLGLGRYALGLLWFRVLTGMTVSDNSFSDFDEPVSDEEISIVKACVESFSPDAFNK